MSTTDRNTRSIAASSSSFDFGGQVYTFELVNPVQVEPGDIVGIETELLCPNSNNFDNIRSVNVSGSDSDVLSYRRSTVSTLYTLNPLTTTTQPVIPLLIPVYGQFDLSSSDIGNSNNGRRD